MRAVSFAMALGLALLSVLGSALLPAPALAQAVLPVPPLSGRVVDQTATLTPPQAAAIGAKLEAIEKKNGAQVVVLIVPTTQPEDIASFAERVGEQWKIGRKVEGDGLLVTVAKNDRAVDIHVAKALQGAVPDIAAGRIIRDVITPAFRAGDFAGGLNSAVDRLGERIAGEGLPAPKEEPAAGRPRGRGFNFQDIAIFLFVGVPILGGLLSRVMGRKLGALATGVGVGAIGWFLTASLLIAGGAGLVALFLVGVMGVGGSRGGLGGPIIFGGGGGGFGGGGGGGGGGFSSGGGGGFDGGGASGRW